MATPRPHKQNGSVARLRSARPSSGHKGAFGQVVRVAGTQLMPSAAILCRLGVLYSGAGLVRWATHTNTVPMAPARPTELMLALRDAPRLNVGAELAADKPAASRKDAKVLAKHVLSYGGAVVVGPGLGQSPDALALCRGCPSAAL